MIKFLKGNLLDADAEALVNTVNTVGVMGKGIALQFKNRFPQNYKIYRDACKLGTFNTGEVLVVQEGDLYNKKFVVNFPTKAHWKGNSKYEYITTGLDALKKAISEYGIKSIAIPPLGCGNGGLDWSIVREMIVKSLGEVPIDILVYEPNESIKQLLQTEVRKDKPKLTPARAMLMYMLFAYETAGEQSSLFVANKLAYFLQRSGEPLKLKFEAHHYGPYAVQLNHVLYNLNGVYLKGMEQNSVKPFESLQLDYNRMDEIKAYVKKELKAEQFDRLNSALQLINRFESTFALELLATVDFIMQKEAIKEPSEILQKIASWSNRKAEIFKPEHVKIAVDHLLNHAERSMTYA